MSASRSFDHTDHVHHRWRRFLNHDSKGYAGFSVLACGLQFAKVLKSHRKSRGVAYLIRKTTEKLPKLMMYPLLVGIPGAELLAWGVSYMSHHKEDDHSSRLTRNAKLAPAVFAVYGTTLNTVYPLVGRLRRLRGWFRPIKWGAAGLVLDRVVTKCMASRSTLEDVSSSEK